MEGSVRSEVLYQGALPGSLKYLKCAGPAFIVYKRKAMISSLIEPIGSAEFIARYKPQSSI